MPAQGGLMHATATAQNVNNGGSVARRLNWRVVDIVVAAVLGVAIGLVFWAWNTTIGYAWFSAADALTPVSAASPSESGLLGGVVGGLVIRKPGAALVVEVVAAIVSMLIGNIWGVSTVLEGIARNSAPS